MKAIPLGFMLHIRTYNPQDRKMPYLIGTDEAGYGPNLGPLLISTTVWWVDDPSGGDGETDGNGGNIDLYQRLARTVVTKPKDAGPERLAMADSKVLYKPGRGPRDSGLRHLERGLFTALALTDRQPRDWHSLWAALDPQSDGDRRALPWHDGYGEPKVPIDANEPELTLLEAAMRENMEAAGVHLVDIRSRAVFPQRFNRLCDQSGTKGAVLSNLTLDLLAGVVEPLGYDSIKIICDKHGGRSKYAPLLQEHFPGHAIEILEEGLYLSRYRFGPANRRMEISFQAKGRIVAAGRVGLDGLEVPTRAGHAGTERLLVLAHRRTQAHGRISARRQTFQGRDRKPAKRTEYRRSDYLAESVERCGFLI